MICVTVFWIGVRYRPLRNDWPVVYLSEVPKMSVERTIEGAYAISAVRGGYLVHRLYFGWSRRDAIKMFRAEFPARSR